jgi:tRNA(adenine34) deaminase
MCAGAIVLARIPAVVYGTPDPKAGAADTLYSLLTDSRLNHTCSIVRGVLGPECGAILSEFFSNLRKQKNNDPKES